MFSKWHKIDFHIHTDKSRETKDNDYQGVFSIDKLLEKLLENEVELFSLTDHNIVNENAYKELSTKNINFLVGIELDIAISDSELEEYITKIDSGANAEKINIKPFHIIVLFKSNDFMKISKKLEKMYTTISVNTLKNKIDLCAKKKLRVTTFEMLATTFIEDDYFIIAHGNKNKGIVKPYKEANLLQEAQYEILFGEISALEMKSHINMIHVIGIYNPVC